MCNPIIELKIVVKRAIRTVKCKQDRPVIIIHHESLKSTDGEDEKVYALPRWFEIVGEGPSEQLLAESSSTEVVNTINNGDINTEQEVEAHSIVNMINKRGRIIHSDLADLNGQVDIGDDNTPAPENIPSPNDSNGCVLSNNWGRDGVCPHRQAEGFQAQTKIFNF